jgi:hypothetical protein
MDVTSISIDALIIARVKEKVKWICEEKWRKRANWGVFFDSLVFLQLI